VLYMGVVGRWYKRRLNGGSGRQWRISVTLVVIVVSRLISREEQRV
jgi:hypothetical protein